MIRGINVAAVLTGPLGAAGLALLVAAAATLAARRWRGLADAVAPLAVLAGWAALVPRPAAWLRPHATVEHLVLPAAVLVGVALLRGRLGARAGRWAGAAGAGFAAWWLAAAAGPEFWRAMAGTLALAGVLARGRERLVAGALVLWGGTVLNGAGPAGVAAVLAGAFVPGGAAVPLALGIVATELGAGRLPRGQVGVLEVACLLAVAAPFVARGIEKLVTARGMRRPWAVRGAGAVGAACLGIAVAWAAGRFWRP